MIRIEARRHFTEGSTVEYVTLKYFTTQEGIESHVATERVSPEDFPDVAAGMRNHGAQIEYVWNEEAQ